MEKIRIPNYRLFLFSLLTLWQFVGAQVPCTAGKADIYPCQNVDLIGHLSKSDLGIGAESGTLAAIWGWRDPQTQKDYALVGHSEGTSFVDVSQPEAPKLVGILPLPQRANKAGWRELKPIGNYLYIVGDGAGHHGMQVFNLERLRNATNLPQYFQPDAWYAQFGSSHNIATNEVSQTIYVTGISTDGTQTERCGGGLYVMNAQNPLQPQFQSCFQHPQTGRHDTGYAHDVICVVYQGKDVDWKGKEICIGFNENWVSFADATQKTALQPISKATYPGVVYIHQGWISASHDYLYVNDELDERNGIVPQTTTHIFDIRDLDNPERVAVFTSTTHAIDHNLYIRDNLLYASNYTVGLRIVDISLPVQPKEIAYFDTYWQDDEISFWGQWGNYPYSENGLVIASDRNNGLFLLAPRLNQKAELKAEHNSIGNQLVWQHPPMMYGLTHFILERSEDGQVFRAVDEIPLGTLQHTTFSFTDIAASPSGQYRIRYVLKNSSALLFSETVAVSSENPSHFALGSVFPHPVLAAQPAYIPYALNRAQTVQLKVYNALGQQVAVLVDAFQEAGYYQIKTPTGLVAGVYYYELKTASARKFGEFVVE